MTTLKILFWICFFLVVYTYIGYGVLLWLLVKLKRIFKGKGQPLNMPEDEALPHVTFLICAYNEQDVVEMKMENTLQLDYPKNEITVMTDANTLVNKEALREITKYFQDPTVACVAGEKRVMARNEGETAAQGEGLYWRYESTLKQLDSEFYSTMGAAGELNAILTALYKPMPENALLDDFVMSMRMVDEGYRIAYAPNAYAMEYGSANLHEESKRKRRIAAGGLQSSWWLRNMMNPFRNVAVAFQFVSHRVLRWTITPFALVALIPLNVLLLFMNAGTIYTILWALQVLFYLAAFWGYLLAQRGKKHKLTYIPYYFMFMNMNVFRGIHYLRTHQGGGTWEKAKRG